MGSHGSDPAPDADSGPVERFDTGGRTTGWMGLVASIGTVVAWVASRAVPDSPPLLGERPPVWVLSAAVLAGLLFWSAVLRPRVLAQGDVLVLRNMFEDVRIPLAAVQEHAVRQVLAVGVDGRRYVASGVGRSFAASRRTSVPAPDGAATRGIHPADFVETRIAGLAADARDRRGVRHRSAEQAALAADVVRSLTWSVIVPLAVTLVALALSILLR